jgi:ElaB/YqjD/DUF883 family membrane-anchored ribosome-binding protein
MGILNKAAVRTQGALDQIADAAAPAAQWLEDEADALASGRAKFLDTTSKYIAAHPLQSLGLAIAAGYLLSRLTR